MLPYTGLAEYAKDKKSLGDTPEQDPIEQRSNRALITYGDFDAIFDALPLVRLS
jgi:hypothetical protein